MLKRVGGDNQRVFYLAQKHFVYQEFWRFAGFVFANFKQITLCNTKFLRIKRNIAAAGSEVLAHKFKKTLLVASAEVSDALADCQAFAMRKEARLLQVSAAQKAFENSRETMRYAQTSYLEVLTAQNSYLEAQLQESADFLEFQQCLINLYKAVCYE